MQLSGSVEGALLGLGTRLSERVRRSQVGGSLPVLCGGVAGISNEGRGFEELGRSLRARWLNLLTRRSPFYGLWRVTMINTR
jgi:hypothetical protein